VLLRDATAAERMGGQFHVVWGGLRRQKIKKIKIKLIVVFVGN
jgi:hypothetical protein